MAEAAGTSFINLEGREISADPTQGMTAFYFTVPQAADFSKQLAELYPLLKVADPDFEIFYVSNERGREKMLQLMQSTHMPWPGVLCGSEEAKAILKIKRTVLHNTVAPTLIVVRNNRLITMNGQRDVRKLGARAYQKWNTMEPEEIPAPAAGKPAPRRTRTPSNQKPTGRPARPASGEPVEVDPAVAPKIDPIVIKRLAQGRPVPVIILCKTQFLEMPDGFRRFCKENANRTRIELRKEVIGELKKIAANGEQNAVRNLLGNPRAESLWIVNAVSTALSADALQAVAKLDEVKYIYSGLPPRRNAKDARISEVISPSKRTPFKSRDFTIPWNLEKIGAVRVWMEKENAGENIVVAMLEGGVDYTHEDLRNNLWVNEEEIPNNGRDDDDNGLIDDYYGFNFATGSCEVRATTPKQHHGTLTAGIVAGDGTGGTITGVAPRARLMLLAGHAAYASQYALEQGADVMSMSFSIPNLGNGRGLFRLMSEHAVCAGLVLVSGCGNFQRSADIPVQIRIPEGIPCVIGAGGLDESLNIPFFCSLGPVEWGSVKFYEDYPLPGGLIKPDVCGFTGPGYPQLAPDNGDYIDTKKGNSFSAPHIAGVAALMLSANPELPAWRVRELMEETAYDLDDKGKDPRTGAGLVDAWKAVSAAESESRR